MNRCIGCGKELGDGPAFRIAKGRVVQGEFKETEDFGTLHEICFYGAVDTPESVLYELGDLGAELSGQA